MKITQITDEKELKKVKYSFVESPFGRALMAATPTGLCYVAFLNKQNAKNEKDAFRGLKKYLPKTILEEGTNSVIKKASKFNKHAYQTTNLEVKGTVFQIEVWKALKEIPTGYLSVYSTVAKKIKNPKAVRAVGSAIGANPIAYFIPCHRVIRSDGGLGGYHWGIKIKEVIINEEAKNPDILNKPQNDLKMK